MPFISRRKSSTASQRAAEADKIEYVAYRDGHEVKYVPVRKTYQSSTAFDDDSDSMAPLVRPALALEGDANNDEMQRFTATGRPITDARKRHGNASSGIEYIAGSNSGFLFAPPKLLPAKFTDDSIIPVIVTNLAPSYNLVEPEAKKKSLLGRLSRRPSNNKPMKVIYMPRRDYLKHFAHDEAANYIGTEPERQWTVEELETQFGKYKPVTTKK